MFEKALTNALTNFFESPKGQALVGQIMLNAVSQSLTKTIQIEDGKTEPGKKVIKEKSINVLDHLAKYLPYIEASIRGVQVDAGQARNRSQQTLNEIGEFKHIFAEEIERRNTIGNEILAKALILSKSHTLQAMSLKDAKSIESRVAKAMQDKEKGPAADVIQIGNNTEKDDLNKAEAQ